MTALAAVSGVLAFTIAGVRADSVGQVQTAKRISRETVAVIDPESGTSTGGGSGDVRVAPGDILTFVFQFTPVPNGAVRGLGGYITEYVPANTEVVGARIIDRTGRTVFPHRGGLAADGWGPRGMRDYSAFGLQNGSMTQLYADTGIFFSTDPRTVRTPAAQLITVSNGLVMSPEPTGGRQLDNLVGVPAGGPLYAHNRWDWLQVMAYGTGGGRGAPPGGDINTNGTGNTPYLYGSPVAGPETFYRFEATETMPGLIQPNGTVGPWRRIAVPGSEIGRGMPATVAGTTATGVQRIGVPTALGWDLSTTNPLPAGTNAVRYAVGELVVGDEYFAEISLRVLDTPIDPAMMDNANCAEVFGGDASARSTGAGGKDNTWRYYLASPACVLLNLLFELRVDRLLAVNGDLLTYTIEARNLSTLPQTNVRITDTLGPEVAFVSATGGGVFAGGTITWPAIPSWAPSATFNATVTVRVTAGGGSTLNRARYVSNERPAGFDTIALTDIGERAIVGFGMVPAPSTVAPGGRFRYTTTIRNSGNGVAASTGCAAPGCQYIVTLPAGFTIVPGSSRIGGVAVANPTLAGGRYTYTAGLRDVPAGGSVVVEFDVDVAAATAPGLYTACFETWHDDVGYGQTINDSICGLGEVAVGTARAAAPVVSAPIGAGSTCVSGTSTEPDGTTIRVLLNGVERGTTTVMGGTWRVCGLPPVFGGMEVTATAESATRIRSPLSAPVFVSSQPGCSDGADNDGDGRVDFPADPGCSSPTDGDEVDPECSNSLDDDADGGADFPRDLECSSPDDPTESGPPACGNGIDDDGDGAVDFPADTGCTGLTDRSEVTYRRCQNGLDDDGDGRIDFGADPGCHSSNDDAEGDFADPARISARLLVVMDTSGSMNWNTCADTFTGGDGSAECAGMDVACATCGTGGCGNSIADDSRLFKVKTGLSEAVGAFGEVEWGLMRFHQRATSFVCPGVNASLRSGGWQGAGASPCGGGFNAGDLLVGFSPENTLDLLEWMDGSDDYPGTAPPAMDFELRGSGTTPIAGALGTARTELDRIRSADTRGACRPYRVILVTDGGETCGGDPVAAATSLRTAGYRVHVIGFATPDPSIRTGLDAIAAAGGTTSAVFADDSVALSDAIAQIIRATVLVETCNDLDDDCDTLIDEGFVKYCNRPAGMPARSLCTDPGEAVCDGVDDNCDGRTDEGLLNACGLCGPVPAEVCDGVDNDCDGIIDEPPVCACRPSAEICDDLDNDCDTRVDEGVTRGCGTDVGECTTGTQTCSRGVFGPCTGVTPVAETCNGLDDDCDGSSDGFSRPCGIATGACEPGLETCTAGAFGPCLGATGPGPEVCDGEDDDCDGRVDEGNPGGGAACGSGIGACRPGTFACVGGTLTCTGGVGPAAETCNSTDDDCDGAVDEAVPSPGPCGTATGECEAGALACVGGSLVCTGGRGPVTEVCNLLDDDCDTRFDEGDPGGGAACGAAVGPCRPGTLTCIAGTLTCRGGVGPASELCNSVDDDCDGLIDEANPEGGSSCGTSDTGECDFGVETCRGGSLVCVGETGPRPEACNGLDDDCDGAIDEGDPEGGMACGDDTGECSAGVTRCTGGMLVCDGGIAPALEVCNGLDDDCDGVVDDGLGLGAPCGSGVGECLPGTNVCRDGMIVCEGGLGPRPESCNLLDDDCDSRVDEDATAGGPCGVDDGECRAGMLECVDGVAACVGEVPPSREECNCLDDDCNGAIDDPPPGGSLCPPGAACLDCSCALACVEDEFGTRCPAGRMPVIRDGACFCAAELCNAEACAAMRIERDGELRCDPTDPAVAPCVCNGADCTDVCAGASCTAPLVCNPRDGRCVENDCRGLGCADGQICDRSTGECVDDPCVTAGCGPDEVCRVVGGVASCETSCATVECDAGERCRRGVCVMDGCAGVTCAPGEGCDPATGECVADPCEGVRCPSGERCVEAECVRPGADAGPPASDAGADPERRVLAAGGGGCSCRADSRGASPGGVGWLATLVLAALVARRRRR